MDGTISAKKKKVEDQKISGYVVFRHMGDIIDSHISWPWKHFFTSKIVLRVIWLLSIIFAAAVPCLRVVVSSVRVIVLSSSGHHWPFFQSSITFDGCYTSLGRFHVFVSSVFPFVDFGAYLVYNFSKLCISFFCCNRIIF